MTIWHPLQSKLARHTAQYTAQYAIRALAVVLLSTTLSVAIAKPTNTPSKEPLQCSFMAHPANTNGENIRIIGAQPDSTVITDLKAVVSSLTNASNKHDLAQVLSHYAPRFKSGDHLTLAQIKKMLSETWEHYPDIQYTVTPIEIRIHGDWATIETIDSATATSQPVSEPLPNERGELFSQSRGMLYLHRVGKTWEITGDRTLYENALISYGKAKGVDISLSAPDQVFAGDAYTARIHADVPDELIAITSIASDPIVFPQATPEDRFRSLSPHTQALERVFEANPTHHNEMITATLGLTRVKQDSQNRPLVTFEGIATIMKRVNVSSSVPSNMTAGNTQNLINYSADGMVDLRTPSTENEPK